MPDDNKDRRSVELDELLTLSPDEVLITFQLDMRHKLEHILPALELVGDKESSQEEHDYFLEIAKQNSVAISQMLNLILSYLKARQDMNNPNDKH